MKIIKILLASLLITLTGCKNKEEALNQKREKIQVQGHRGDRGNFPENTIPAFISAVKKGVPVLELDVVVSKDQKVVVSHEPFMSSIFTLTPNGDSISREKEVSFNLYEMSYDSIRKFDVGSKGNLLFPEQQKVKTYKPLLSEVIDSVESFIASEGLKPVKYNIELKSVKAEYGIYQPYPEEFIELVIKVVKEKGNLERIIIQSFDPAILNLMNKKHPEIPLAFLVSKNGIQRNLSYLKFTPDVYSPHYLLVNKHFVDSIKSLEMDLIPWTVNEPSDIKRLIKFKVDGIISDYPERVIKEIN